MEQMKIAIACFSPHLGGMELDALKYASLFSPTEQVFLFYKKNSPLSYELKSKHWSLALNRVKKIDFNFHSNWSLLFAWNLRQSIIQNKIEMVVFFGASELKALAPALIGLKVKLVMRHGTTKTDSKKDWFHKLLYKSVHGHVPISQHLAANVEKIFPITDESNIKMIYNFVDINPEKINDSFQYKDQFLRKDKSILELLHVGRINEGKGQLEALKALLPLKEKGIPFKFTLVGPVDDEVYHQTLQQFVTQNNLSDHVVFAGYHQNVSSFYQQAHILLFPSHGEGLPNVVLEALSYGLIVVAFENTIFPELKLLGFCLHLAKNMDQSSLNKKLEHIAETVDGLLKKSMHQNTSLIKQYFSKDVVLQQWIGYLRTLIKCA